MIFPIFFGRRLTLRARIYLVAAATLSTVVLYLFHSLYAQEQLANITREILDQRIVAMQAADKVKHTLFRDENALFRYLATRNPNELIIGEHLGQKALDQIAALRPLSRNMADQTRLDLLDKEIRRYFSDAQKAIDFSRQNAFPRQVTPEAAAAWALHRPQKRRILDVLAGESEARLTRMNSLCDELILVNQREMQEARIRMRQELARGRQNAFLAAFLVGWVILLVAVGHVRSLLRPLHDLLVGVRHVERGDLNFQIPVSGDDEISRLTSSFNRMTQIVNDQRRQLMQESTTDGLTGLYNQRHFRVLLKQEIERAQRSETDFSLLMIDIDHFKRYNDQFGHEFGNEVLKLMAGTIQSSLREIDTLARYGGDELAVIMPGASSGEAQSLAERIQAAIADQHFAGQDTLPMKRVTLSIGGASYLKDAQSVDELIEKADQALYTAKRAGRACLRWANGIEDAQKAG